MKSSPARSITTETRSSRVVRITRAESGRLRSQLKLLANRSKIIMCDWVFIISELETVLFLSIKKISIVLRN